MFHTNKILKRRMMCLSFLASLGLVALLSLAQTDAALAATAPNLGTTITYGVISSTTTNNGASTINGDFCYTTIPSPFPTVNGTVSVPCPPLTGTDQAAARGDLLSQPCTPVGAIVDLSLIDVGSGAGVFPPGCYSSTGAMSIGSTISLTGSGVYIFRPGGALNTADNSIVNLTNGACESDVYWAPNGATGIGANATFAGNILEGAAAANDITIGSTVSFIGRALAFGHTVNMDADTITVPTCAAFVPQTPTLGKAFSPSVIDPNVVSVLTITLSNPITSAAVLTAALTDTLPTNVVIAPIPNPNTTCGGSGAVLATAGGSTVILPALRSIPAGSGSTPGTCTVTVNVTGAIPGSYLNTLGPNALQTTNGNNANTAVATLIVNPPLAPGFVPPTVGKSFLPPAIGAGSTSTVTIILSNSSSDTADTNATFTDTLPTGLVIANPANPTITNCGGGAVLTTTPGTGIIQLTGATIPAGSGTTSGTCTVTVDVTATASGVYLNTMVLQTDQGAGANTATATLTVAPPAAPPTPIPTLNEWGMIIFMLLTGLGSVYYLRKYRRA